MLPEIDSMILGRPSDATDGFLNSNANKILCTISSSDRQQIATNLGIDVNNLSVIFFIFKNTITKDTLVVKIKVSETKSSYKGFLSLRFDQEVGNYEETTRAIILSNKSRINTYKGIDYFTGTSFTVF